MRVVFLGAFDPDYPRTRVLREGLEGRGVEVRILTAPARPLAREAGIVMAWAGRAQGADAILVPSFGHRDVPLASLLARTSGVPLLFDPLVSRWDTQVGDLERIAPRSFAAARLRFSDRLSMGLADRVLCDTWEHGELFASSFGIPRRKLVRVPVGADHAAFALAAERGKGPPRAPLAPLEVCYVGGFLPLHGVPVIVRAAAMLEARRGASFARFTLIGDGMTAHETDRDTAALGLRSLRRLPRVPYAQALEALARADVALGIFGTTEKAGRVVPHKVYQALAAGVPLVTRRSAAVTELLEPAGSGVAAGDPPLVSIPAGNPGALADALEALAHDPERRERIGAAGRKAALQFATPDAVGAELIDAIERVRGSRS